MLLDMSMFSGEGKIIGVPGEFLVLCVFTVAEQVLSSLSALSAFMKSFLINDLPVL